MDVIKSLCLQRCILLKMQTTFEHKKKHHKIFAYISNKHFFDVIILNMLLLRARD